jgi:hypothetical protein
VIYVAGACVVAACLMLALVDEVLSGPQPSHPWLEPAPRD